ncbi:MAG: YfhO family protein [Blastocatellia bacterium]
MDSNLPDNSLSNHHLARIAVAGALVLLPLVYFFPAVLGKVTLAPGDGWTQIFGIRILTGQMIARGEWPLWNPYIFAGMPLLAAIQPGALYPPTWLFALLPPQWAMNVLVITTYHLALIGAYLYARRIGITRIGAIISGITFTFGGYMIAHLGHTNRINAAAWLPWILLAIEGLHQRARWRWVASGAFFIALQLFAGEPQMTLYTAMTAGAYALFTLLFRAESDNRVRFAAALAAMAVCGALLSMIQLLPARELLQLGDRAGLDYEYFSQYSLPPRQTLGLFFPYFFGGAVMPPYHVPYWGQWNVTETCGYVGMAAWLLALVAVFNWCGSVSGSDRLFAEGDSADLPSRYRSPSRTDTAWLTRFWVCCGGAALLLSFGAYLPFGLYGILHHVPVYSLFRASARHLVTFDFAIAVLAGLGATALMEADRMRVKQALIKAVSLLALIVGLSATAYCFLGRWLMTDAPPQQSRAGTWSNPELYIPLIFFALSVGAAVVFARRGNAATGAAIGPALAIILFLDLMSFGFFYEWRTVNFNVADKLADPPTVKFIKERESDLNAFRIVSRSDKPYARNADLLDYPNISIARGLQSVNGYDPVRLGQMAEVGGRVTLDGVIAEPGALSAAAQGFNLLNAKYLLNERPTPLVDAPVIYDGVRFDARRMDLTMPRWAQARCQAHDGNATATELAIISVMEHSKDVADGAPVLNVKLHTTSGQVIERQLLAGRDTSEWTPDSAADIASWNTGGFRGRGVLAHLKFDRAEIESIEFESVLDHGELIITRASLFDAVTAASHPLDAVSLPPERWRKLAEFDGVDIYENLKAMPRAWFTPGAIIVPSVEVLRTIKTGRLIDGSQFDPAETVLLESELFSNRALKTPIVGVEAFAALKGEVKITRYQPLRIELQVRNQSAGFLCLSEIYYRGWEVRVDGQRASIDRVNFTLRGVELQPGDHKVEFMFRAHSFRNGATWSVAGLLLLCIGGGISYRKRKEKLMKVK